MDTPYDWISLAIFSGILALFVKQLREREAPDLHELTHYLIPSVGCSLANYFGNKDMTALAILLILGTIAYIARFLVFSRSNHS